MGTYYETLAERLKSVGYKFTPQRKQILEILLNHPDGHLTPEEIHAYVKEVLPHVGLATVYRTLAVLCELEVITKMSLDGRSACYEIKSMGDAHQHHHLICTGCGKIIEVADDSLDELEMRIERTYAFTIVDHKLKFYGLCDQCMKAGV